MGILDEDVARVRDQTDLVALVGEHVALRRVGQRYVGLCPFHQEKTPSFNVNPALGFYKCFGCQKSGDAITFVREIEGLDFVDTVEELAKRAGITLRYDDRAQAKDRSRRDRLVAAVERGDRVLPTAAARGRARRTGTPVSAQPRLRRRCRASVRDRVVARRLGPARGTGSSRSASSRVTTSWAPASRS